MGRRHACSCSHRDPYHYMRLFCRVIISGDIFVIHTNVLKACALLHAGYTVKKSVAKVGAGPKGGIVDGSYGRREDNRAGRRASWEANADSLSEHDHKNTPIVSLEIPTWCNYLRNGDSYK
jgi:hypothetical protein